MNPLFGELIKCLDEERPAVLFLGQNAWANTIEKDPVLVALSKRLGRSEILESGWKGVLTAPGLTADDSQWLAERYNRHVQSEAFQSVLDVAWSAVFTTSIDAKLTRRLETRGRQPESVTSKNEYARVPRSRFRPPVHFLFGRSNEASAESKIPFSSLELRQKVAVNATSILSRIPETVTPLGVLVIDGYVDGQDWLEIDSLLAPLSISTNLRILWFGCDGCCTSEFFKELVDKGTLSYTSDRLSDCIAFFKSIGSNEEIGSAASDDPGIITLENGSLLDVSPATRLRVEASAAIVDDEWTTNTTSPELDLKDMFARFHGDFGGTRALVEGIINGFAIKREFETRLRAKVEGALKDQGNLRRFVVLYGQSGTGKTVAIARLAHDLRRDIKVPVLYAKGRLPLATDIDDFCEAAERAGALGTVILCDCNQSVHRYRDLSNALRSRGRRITIVGTTYKTEAGQVESTSQAVEARYQLSAREKDDLVRLVTRFSGFTPGLEDALDADHVLPLLYRILTSGRDRIVSGINSEARATENVIRERAKAIPGGRRWRSDLAEQLIAAGFHDGNISLFEDDDDAAKEGLDAAGVLIDYVMVAGRVNCQIPINLLIRTLNSNYANLELAQIYHLFSDIDLFRWREADAEGNELLIGPRLQLEAELICRRRLGDKDRELSALIQLIENVRSFDVDSSSELNFLLDLLQKLDKSGPRGVEYAEGYLLIGKALTKLREVYKVEDARLMLQESAFRRAALWRQDRPGNSGNKHKLSDDARSRVLDEAREVVEIAIREIGQGRLRAGRRTKENLQVERAAIYCYLAVGKAISHATRETVWSNYLAARTAISQAKAVADSYFPLDLGLWTPVDIISSAELSKVQRAEMIADIYSVMDEVDPKQLTTSQRDNYQRRKYQISGFLKDDVLADEAYNELQDANPALAYFLRARTMGSLIFKGTDNALTREAMQGAASAAAFLKERIAIISTDIRSLTLLLQFEWAAMTGHRLLRGERKPIPAAAYQLAQIRSIVGTLNRVAGDSSRYVHRYLEATVEWISGETHRAADIWASISRETEYEDPSRMIRRLYLAGDDGRPVMYRGRVERSRGDSRWTLSVEGLPGMVELLERDFKNEDLRIGRELRDFAVSFNYLGAIADPASRFGGKL